jgi:hypothetical protein
MQWQNTSLWVTCVLCLRHFSPQLPNLSRYFWAYSTGKPLGSTGFTRWSSSGQPDNAGGKENCGSIHRNGGMNDIPCPLKLAFICEHNPWWHAPASLRMRRHRAWCVDVQLPSILSSLFSVFLCFYSDLACIEEGTWILCLNCGKDGLIKPQTNYHSSVQCKYSESGVLFIASRLYVAEERSTFLFQSAVKWVC